MTPPTVIADQEKDRAGTSSNADTKSSPSSPQASPARSDAETAGTLPEAKALAQRTEVEKDWKFCIGIHRGTLTSRDSEPPKEAESLEQCREMAKKAQRDYASLGCQIWYCYALAPGGQRYELIPGAPYR